MSPISPKKHCSFSSHISKVVKLQYLNHIGPDHQAIARDDKARQGRRRGGPKCGKTNPRWRTAAILEIHKQLYLGHLLTDVHIWFEHIDHTTVSEGWGCGCGKQYFLETHAAAILDLNCQPCPNLVRRLIVATALYFVVYLCTVVVYA